MFVAKWEPGVVPVKPELTSAPIWLELRNVPFQFFSEEGLEHIAGLVGDPKFLHPATANKTNLEMAKVFTLIDPRKPLPEAVNVQFESGEIRRVNISSPWMPPVCAHCKEIGHSLRHCKAAPITCKGCSSTTHGEDNCPKAREGGPKKRRNQRRRRSKSPEGANQIIMEKIKDKEMVGQAWVFKEVQRVTKASCLPDMPVVVPDQSTSLKPAEKKNFVQGETSGKVATVGDPISTIGLVTEGFEEPPDYVVNEDSSDTLSGGYEEDQFTEVLSKSQRKRLRGKGLKSIS